MTAGAALSLLKDLGKPAKVAVVVGTALCLINGTFAAEDYFRIVLNFLVPFLVSAYSRQGRRHAEDGASSRPTKNA